MNFEGRAIKRRQWLVHVAVLSANCSGYLRQPIAVNWPRSRGCRPGEESR
jgi:hypothetical protein